MSSPSNTTRPPVGSSSRITHRAIVDLPHPDSPTTPSVSPLLTVNETPSTARTRPISRWNTIPRVIGKCFSGSSTTSSSSGIGSSGRHGHHGRGELLRLSLACVLVEVAGDPVLGVARERIGRRLLVPADVHDVRAAKVEPASGWRVQQRGRRTRDRMQLALLF